MNENDCKHIVNRDVVYGSSMAFVAAPLISQLIQQTVLNPHIPRPGQCYTITIL